MQNSITRYVSFRENGKDGVVDSTGEIIVNAIYDSIQPFFGDFAKVQINGKFGLINKRGKMITGKFYNRIDIRYWGNDYQNIYIIHCGNKKGFYLDGSEEFSGFRYNSIGTLHNDRALISIQGLYGYINGKGEIAIPPQFTSESSYEKNIASVSIDFKSYYIDPNQNEVELPKLQFIHHPLSEQVLEHHEANNHKEVYESSIVRELQKSDFTSTTAWELFQELTPYSIRLGTINNFVVLFNQNGKIITPSECLQIKMVSYNRFIATVERFYEEYQTVYSTEGEELLPPVFDEIIHLKDDVHIIRLDKHYGLAKEGGKFIGRCNYTCPQDIPEILEII